MLRKLSKQGGNISIIFILVIIIIVLLLVLMFKVNGSKNSEVKSQYTNIDVYSWLDDIEKVDNISYDHYHSTSDGNVSHTKRYLKGTTMKIEYLDEYGNIKQDIMIEDLTDKTHIFYNENTKKGRKINILASKSKYVYVDFTYSFSELKDERYKISETLLDDKECIKAQGVENTIYFDKDTKLIVKIEDTENTLINMTFKNISVDSVTENDISVPNDITIEDKTK